MKNSKSITLKKKVTLNKVIISSFTKSQSEKNGVKAESGQDTKTSLECDLTITK